MAARDDLNNWDRLVESWGGDTQGKFGLGCAPESLQNLTLLDCETARIFAYSSTRDRHIKYIYQKKKYARAVKQKVWNEAENRERNWGETPKNRPHMPFGPFARVRLLRHGYRFLYRFWEKKRTVLQSKPCIRQKISLPILRQETLFYGPDFFLFCVQYKVIF